MKKVVLYILLAIFAVALSACSVQGKVVTNTELHTDSPYALSLDSNGYSWSVPPRWLLTENSKFATDRWRTGIRKDLYFSPKAFFEAEFDSRGIEQLRDIYFQTLMDSVGLNENSVDCSIPNKWTGQLCDYVAFIEYDKIDVGDSLDDTVNGLTSNEPDSTLIENIIGRLVVTAVVTSVGEEDCNIPIKLLERKLSEVTDSPIFDGLLLYLAQESNDFYVFHGQAFLHKLS